jgi:hypothetical protein
MTLLLLGLLILWRAMRRGQPVTQSRRSAHGTTQQPKTEQRVAGRLPRDWWKSPPPYDPAWGDGIKAKPF